MTMRSKTGLGALVFNVRPMPLPYKLTLSGSERRSVRRTGAKLAMMRSELVPRVYVMPLTPEHQHRKCRVFQRLEHTLSRYADARNGQPDVYFR